MGEHADAAAEVRALAGELWQGLDQGRGPRIDPVPAEHARLRPESAHNPRGAFGDALLDPCQVRRPLHVADAVTALRAFHDLAAERLEFLLKARTAPVLRGHGKQRRAGLQRFERQGQDVAPLHGSGRREDGRFVERLRPELFQHR